MAVLTRDEALAVVQGWTRRLREGKKTPPGTRLEAAAECVGRLRPEFDSFESWFAEVDPLPGRYRAHALTAAWATLGPDERAIARDRVKREAAANHPQAAIWLTALLVAVDPEAADVFASITANRLHDHPNQDVLKALRDALAGSAAPTPLEQLAARPSISVMRLWRAVVVDSRTEDIPSVVQPGLLAAGVALAARVAEPAERSWILGVIADRARSLSASGWGTLAAAAAAFPEAASVLARNRATWSASSAAGSVGTGGLAGTPSGGPAGARSDALPYAPGGGTHQPVTAVSSTVAAVGFAAEPRRPSSAPVGEAGHGATDPPVGEGVPRSEAGGPAEDVVAAHALDALARFVETYRATRRRVEAVEARLRASLEQLREAQRAGAAAEDRCAALDRRLGEAVEHGRALEARVAELQAEVQALQGFGDRRFQAGQDQLAARLARDLGLHLEHVVRFADAAERTEGERHLICLIDGIVRELAGHGVVVPWQ